MTAITQPGLLAAHNAARPVGSPITILVCALGGEGGGVLTEWLYEAAIHAGYAAQCTSVPGVAQRTGATTYYIEIHPEPSAQTSAHSSAHSSGRRPIFSLNPVPGALDLLVSSELLETVRQVGNGMSHPQRTQIISSTARALTVAEKMQLSDGRMDAAALVQTLQAHCASAELLDLDALAKQAGTVISAVLLGAVAASGSLPLPRSAYEYAIRRAGKGVEPSLKGFALAYAAVEQQQRQRRVVEQALQAPAGAALGHAVSGAAAPGRSAVTARASDASGADSAASLRDIARQRMAEYQDAPYAALYDERLARVAAAAGSSAQGLEAVAEVERWLALWMMFDDIVQVARLKLAHSRQARVRLEVKAGPADLVKVFDHFKPGVAEFAALLPARLAQGLMAWDKRRIARGLDPWALPLKVGTHTVLGALALRAVAALKGQRRRGSRFKLEQRLIEQWLHATQAGLRESSELGLELARCGRLIKGYGSTNERGKENLLHIIEQLAALPLSPGERAQAIAQARKAALADDAGRALDQTLVAHGATPRAPREHTVRWFKRRPEQTAKGALVGAPASAPAPGLHSAGRGP